MQFKETHVQDSRKRLTSSVSGRNIIRLFSIEWNMSKYYTLPYKNSDQQLFIDGIPIPKAESFKTPPPQWKLKLEASLSTKQIHTHVTKPEKCFG